MSSKLSDSSKLATSSNLTKTSKLATSSKLATVSSPFHQARSVLLNGVLLEMKGASLPDIR